MKLARIFLIVTVLIASSDGAAGAGQTKTGTANKRELARKILSNSDLTDVLEEARKLVGSGLRAGSGYGEVWIRDLNTFIELALDTQNRSDLKEALLVFFHFQGEEGNIVDGYIPKEKANVSYKYIKSETMPEYLAHKNTVETDQEASLIQAVCKYAEKTKDDSILREEVNGVAVIKRMELALQFLLDHRFNSKYGLIWGATTSDWGDVQPEHSWGVVLDENSHLAIDIYDNAMFVIAMNNFLELAGDQYPSYVRWKAVVRELCAKIMEHLWDPVKHKFHPHVYLNDSPFPKSFYEDRIYYHGGTTIAMEAGLLSNSQVKRACDDMIDNKKSAGAGTIGLTIYPAYPKGFFANRSMVPWSYQNGGDWTWFGGRTIQQLIRHGLIEEAYQEMLPMVERVRKNNGFYEWYTVDNKPRGSGKFRGSAGVLGKAIIMIRQWAEEHKD